MSALIRVCYVTRGHYKDVKCQQPDHVQHSWTMISTVSSGSILWFTFLDFQKLFFSNINNMGVAHRKGGHRNFKPCLNKMLWSHLYSSRKSQSSKSILSFKKLQFRVFMCIRNRGVVHGQGVVAESWKDV